MRIHHVNLCTMCPYGGVGDLVCHALVVETKNDGVVLVDTGMGLDDVRSPAGRLGRSFVLGVRPRLREEDTALRHIERLGFRRDDVRHIVVTHLDVDHAGGIPDFPDAQIHVHRAEHGAAMARATLAERNRYRKVHFAGNPRWELHEADGERWFGFEQVRAVADDVLLIPLHGHSRGHCAVAVRAPKGSPHEWLLHCGDGYFFHGEMNDPPSCPVALRMFQRGVAIDNEARVRNADRLRTLRRESGSRVRLFSAHSPHEYEALARATESRS
jgi:glyoxylase-like metal-dependent hydrolase (beta-lactamase superfamily II)